MLMGVDPVYRKAPLVDGLCAAVDPLRIQPVAGPIAAMHDRRGLGRGLGLKGERIGL